MQLDIKILRDKKYTRKFPGGIDADFMKVANRLMDDAIKEALLAIVRIISVDSGMSASSLLPFAGKVKVQAQLLALIKSKGPNFSFRKYDSSKYSSVVPSATGFKSQSFGKQLGEKAFTYKPVTSLKRPVFQASFSIPVLQFYLHETGQAKGFSHNWRSLEAASQIADQFVQDNAGNYFTDEKVKQWILSGKDLFEFRGSVI